MKAAGIQPMSSAVTNANNEALVICLTAVQKAFALDNDRDEMQIVCSWRNPYLMANCMKTVMIGAGTIKSKKALDADREVFAPEEDQ